MELDIRTYILLGGGFLIGLVLLHGFWTAWRGRRPLPVLEGGGGAEQGAEQMPLDVDAALLPEAASDAPMQRVAPTVGDAEVPADPALAPGAALARRQAEREETPETAFADEPRRRGRRIEIAGKRTEPTVPRTARGIRSPAAAPYRNGGAGAPEPESAAGQTSFDDDVHHGDATVGQAEDTAGSGAPADEVLVLWVIAKPDCVLPGPTLLQTFSEAGLEYDGQVFHKVADGRELFTVANGVEPGTFDLSAVEAFATRGVVFLLRLSAEDGAEAFDAMLEAAQALAADADAELKDEQRSDVSRQTVMHYRQRVADFKRKSMRR